jgi:hypothetical protein
MGAIHLFVVQASLRSGDPSSRRPATTSSSKSARLRNRQTSKKEIAACRPGSAAHDLKLCPITLRRYRDVEGNGRFLQDHAESSPHRRGPSLGPLQISLNKPRLCGSILLRSESSEGEGPGLFRAENTPASGESNFSSPRQICVCLLNARTIKTQRFTKEVSRRGNRTESHDRAGA